MAWTLGQVQEQLRERELDGWLLFVLQNRNPVAERVLDLPPGQIRTRRAFYWIPASGTPIRLEHAIECRTLAGVPGLRRTYLSYESLRQELGRILGGARRVAMETSPLAAIPALSLVDAGTVDLVRSLGAEVVSSENLAQTLTARLDAEQLRSHFRAAEVLRQVVRDACGEIGRALAENRRISEKDLQGWILNRFESAELEADHPPIVACGPHTAIPHHEVGSENFIQPGQLVLIDLWAKERQAGCIYADQTWMAWTGGSAPDPVVEHWRLVRNARRSVRNLVGARLAVGHEIRGWEADEAARSLIRDAGLSGSFIHRTGHSIDESVHGSGANLDNLETREERALLPGTVMSVEPGIYLPEYGLRSEYNLVIDLDGEVRVAEGTDQEDLLLIHR
ncbi:MAG: M24 family metallopeptidase [Candidatus Delongbacteria bacterium]